MGGDRKWHGLGNVFAFRPSLSTYYRKPVVGKKALGMLRTSLVWHIFCKSQACQWKSLLITAAGKANMLSPRWKREKAKNRIGA